MVHTRRTTGTPTGPERSLLQLERDHLASQMDFTWPPLDSERPNDDSRGIENYTGVTCYQNSVMQTLLHLPPFLRWISTHYAHPNLCPADDCIKCYVKQLAEEYWDDADPDIAVTYPSNDPEDINIEACDSGLFERGQQEDAFQFYTWLLDALSDVPAPQTVANLVIPPTSTDAERRARIAAMRATNRRHQAWQSQIDTLFSLDIQSRDTCHACSYVQTIPMERSRMLSVGVAPPNTLLNQAIADVFQQDMNSVFCDGCQANTTKTRRSTIIAAPKILVVQLQILTPLKTLHALRYSDIISLTAYQAFPTLPLNYVLRGVVSHCGDTADTGHYIASVRQRDQSRFMCISDEETQRFNRLQFIANPQRPTQMQADDFQVYMLVFERADGARNMPRATCKMSRELKAMYANY